MGIQTLIYQPAVKAYVAYTFHSVTSVGMLTIVGLYHVNMTRNKWSFTK